MINPDANSGTEPEFELGPAEDLLQRKGFGEEGVEAELTRLHILCCPPRFVFHSWWRNKARFGVHWWEIKKKGLDLEASVIFLFQLRPLFLPLWPHQHWRVTAHLRLIFGFNPLIESFSEAEINRRSSPHPQFNISRDAKEKLMRKLMEEAEKRALNHYGSVQDPVAKANPNFC